MYAREDNICASVVGIVCLTSHLSQHRRRLPRLFAIEYFNENTVYILASLITRPNCVSLPGTFIRDDRADYFNAGPEWTL